MAVDKHPSRHPSPPRVPPKSHTTAGTINKIPAHDGKMQGGGTYGFRHEVEVHPDATTSTMAHHFHDMGAKKPHKWSADKGYGAHHEGRHPGKEEPNEPSGHHMPKASRPGIEKHDDEPG